MILLVFFDPLALTLCDKKAQSGCISLAISILSLRLRLFGTHEAENARLSGALIDSRNRGFNGTGYADFQNVSGDFIEWTVQFPTGGTHTLDFRYSNGSSANRPLSISVNGALVNSNLTFPPTGGWTSWGNATTSADLPARSVKIRAAVTGSSGANIDSLIIR